MADVCFWTDFAACEEACIDSVPVATMTPGFNIFGANFRQYNRGCTTAQVRSSSSGRTTDEDAAGDVSDALIVPAIPIFVGADYAIADDASDPRTSAHQSIAPVFPLRAVKGDFVDNGVTYHRPPVFDGNRFLVATFNFSDVISHLSGQYSMVSGASALRLYEKQSDAIAGNGNYFALAPNTGFVDPFTGMNNTRYPAFYYSLDTRYFPAAPSGVAEVWGRLGLDITLGSSWRYNATPSAQLLSVSLRLAVSC